MPTFTTRQLKMTIKKLLQAYEAAAPARCLKVTLFLIIPFNWNRYITIGIYCSLVFEYDGICIWYNIIAIVIVVA